MEIKIGTVEIFSVFVTFESGTAIRRLLAVRAINGQNLAQDDFYQYLLPPLLNYVTVW